MKILFSPSETKTSHGTFQPISEQSFLFPELYSKRLEVLKRYQDILNQCDLTTLQQLFGIKDKSKCLELATSDIFSTLTYKAIERYSGVAYESLSYHTLSQEEKDFLDHNTIVFSNLFGPLLANNLLPDYKLHQGISLLGFRPELFYKDIFTPALDSFLKNEFIIDLRAGFYEKFYTLKQPYITMKFLKNGKVVSHFAKAYRGLMLRELAHYKPINEDALRLIRFENLSIYEIVTSKLKTEYVFNIID
ncbi:MAG: YaaA family protein [Sulfurospirillaceae bacterium]|nr:YaaA family protein [Sulfurospirillaceae bacterium]MDD2827819.1 YaaA family protein [Sulfurospirillaceae bacterium]